MVPHTTDVWLGFYLSFDGGTTWFGLPPFPTGFNTTVPGFPTDTSAAGTASPLKASTPPATPSSASVRMATCTSPGSGSTVTSTRQTGRSTPSSTWRGTSSRPARRRLPALRRAGSPPHFTYGGTTVVERGAVGFAVPGVAGFVGKFTDKEWLEVDGNAPASSPCAGNVYVAHTNFHASGASPIVFSTSTDGGASFSHPQTISTGSPAGTPNNQGVDIAVASDGTIYVAYSAFERSTGASSINIVKSTDCGRKWSQPVVVGPVNGGQAPGVAFRTPTFAFVAVDDSNPSTVYVAYQSLSGDYDVYVQRSTNGEPHGERRSRSTPTRARVTRSSRRSTCRTRAHVAWYDFRTA